MGTKERDLRAAEALANSRGDKMKQLNKSVEEMQGLLGQLQKLVPASKETVIDGQKCTVSYIPGRGKTISITFADDIIGNNFINQLP